MKKIVSALCVLALGVFWAAQATFAQCEDDDPSSPVGITPTLVAGNPSLCERGTRIDPPVSGSYNLDTFGNQVTITITSSACGEVFSWSVPGNIVIDQIVAKGGNQGANVYDYTGETSSPTSDGYLHAPRNFNDNTGVYSTTYADLSHIDFCFHYKLDISKTAATSYTRTFKWSIDKSCDGPAELTLTEGQTYNYPFSWTVDATPEDSDFEVTGTIRIENNTPLSATITSVTDQLSDGTEASVVCSGSFTLAAGEFLECTYTAAPGDADPGTNTVTVETNTDLVEGGTATAPYEFGEPTTKVDECVTVTDDCNDPVTVCADDAPHTLEYECPISYPSCGEKTYTNTASFTTENNGVTGSDDCTVAVTVTCSGHGCTLTQGYWKTHSKYGPAPHDDTWDQIGEDTQFFSSGKTYYQVLWTAPAGNAYYILAHQYIAALLNIENGASTTPAVDAALAAATTFFNTYTPSSTLTRAQRNAALALATTLDQYNNGLIGPGHCSEESSTSSSTTSASPATSEKLAEQSLNKTETASTLVPEAFALAQNYPNPFNPSTTFSFDLPKSSTVKLTIFNLAGQEVAVVVNGTLGAGRHTFVWEAPANLISGIYFYKLQTAEFTSVKKMIFQK